MLFTSVRHSHDDGLDAEAGGDIYDLLHGGDQDLASFQAETLLRRIFLGEETLESEYVTTRKEIRRHPQGSPRNNMNVDRKAHLHKS